MQEPEPQSQKDPESIGSPFDPFALYYFFFTFATANHCQSKASFVCPNQKHGKRAQATFGLFEECGRIER